MSSWILFSSASYNIYNYDMSTPIFTPDGLLKQVEYASEASSHSSPMIIKPFLIDDQSFVIMATRKQSRKAQSRIIQMPISPTWTGQTTPLLFGINGVLSDCVSLLQVAREEIQSMSSYGAPSTCTKQISSCRPPLPPSKCAKRVAMAIADKCQQHSFGGGIRPFGAEIIVCGVENSRVGVFVTQPSGGILEFDARASRGELVVGGDAKQREKLYNLLGEKRMEFDIGIERNSIDGFIRKAIKTIIDSMVELHRDTDDEGNTVLADFDIVIAHSLHGVIRIDGDELVRIYENA